MKKITMALSLFAFLGFSVGCNSGNSDTESTDTVSTATTSETSSMATDSDTSMAADREFAMEAASGGLMEVTLGEWASKNASSAAVKEFGQKMVTDHSKANAELKALAATKNITLPTSPIAKHQEHIDMLITKKGAEFDKEYISMMVDDHQEDISKFEKEANDGNDADVKAFAAKTLPVLKQHLETVKAIKDGMK